jgi:hypothetical protein
MSHKRTARKTSHRFELRHEKPDEKRLYDYLLALGQTAEASAWMREACIAYLPAQSKAKPTAQPRYDKPEEIA